MTRERIHQIVDLVLGCTDWEKEHRASIVVDNDGDHMVVFHPYVGERGSESFCYFSDAGRKDTYDPDIFIFDPNFDAAEARIRQHMMDLKGQNDDT